MAISAPVYNIRGEKQNDMNLNPTIFGIDEHEHLVTQYIYIYLTNQRGGNAATKTRSEVVGTTKKVYRQKGTGNARHGAKKASLFVGGGITFGPQPKHISKKMNKKQKRIALLSSLSSKVRNKQMSIIDNSSDKQEPKTKIFSQLFKQLDLEKAQVLFVMPDIQLSNVKLSLRNIPYVSYTNYTTLNPYDLMKYTHVMFHMDAIGKLESYLS